MLPVVKNFGEAYVTGLQALLKTGQTAPAIHDKLSPASRFGNTPRNSIELLGYGFTVKEPRLAVVSLDEGKLDLAFLFGQFLWFIAGSDNLTFLSYYNNRAPHFSHDGSRLCGSFGRRIFDSLTENNQATAVIQLLRSDPGSRRAYISIISREDLLKPTKEVPCNAGIHFFLRDARLHAICTMRAQNAYAVFPYDIFLFCGLQNILASELGVELGTYTHFCDTFHFYENELAEVQRAVTGTMSNFELPPWQGGFRMVAEVVLLEKAVRIAAEAGDLDEVNALFLQTGNDWTGMPLVLKDVMRSISISKVMKVPPDLRHLLT